MNIRLSLLNLFLFTSFNPVDTISRDYICKKLYRTYSNDDYVFRLVDSSNSYRAAQRKCKYCFDADIITSTNFSALHDDSFPFWFGISRDQNDTNWKWTHNDTKIEDFQQFAWRINNLSNLSQDLDYAIVVTLRNYTQEYPLAETNIIWKAVPQRHPYIELNHLRNSFRFSHAVCQHGRRPHCYFKNMTEPTCRYAKSFGCYKHIETIVYDEPDSKCENLPDELIFAVQCDITECHICNVTEWSSWSKCNARQCTDGVKQRTRTRTIIKPCPHSYSRNHEFTQKQNCTVHGCNKLLDPYLP